MWREQLTRYYQSNIVESHSYRSSEIIVWARIAFWGHNDLYVFHREILTGVKYLDEMLDPHINPYAASIGNEFILMYVNFPRATLAEDYLEDP